MESPIEKYIEWFNGLPQAHQEDIAFIHSNTHPGFEDVGHVLPDKISGEFIKVIRELASSTLKTIGTTLSLRASFDYNFYRTRATEVDWRMNLRRMLDMKAFFESKGQDTDFIDRMIHGHAEKERQWIETCEKWNLLRASSLSDDAIEAWYTANTKMAKPV